MSRLRIEVKVNAKVHVEVANTLTSEANFMLFDGTLQRMLKRLINGSELWNDRQWFAVITLDTLKGAGVF